MNHQFIHHTLVTLTTLEKTSYPREEVMKIMFFSALLDEFDKLKETDILRIQIDPFDEMGYKICKNNSQKAVSYAFFPKFIDDWQKSSTNIEEILEKISTKKENGLYIVAVTDE